MFISLKKTRWTRFDYPKVLRRIKTVFDWREYPDDFKETWYDYIDYEFKRREEGFWYINKDKPIYITGTHYMYLQWSKIDVGQPDFRESNRLFFIFWEACRADDRCYGMCYLKKQTIWIFIYGFWRKLLTWLQYLLMLDLVYYQNQVLMLKKCLQIK